MYKRYKYFSFDKNISKFRKIQAGSFNFTECTTQIGSSSGAYFSTANKTNKCT